MNARVPDNCELRRAYDIVPQIEAYMMPLGILTVAAYLPESWAVRVIDENCGWVTDQDLDWADVVLATGMHVQRETLDTLAKRVHRRGKLAVVGGPSVSACPEYHPSFDILHLGELGDATDRLIERIDATISRPESQLIFKTEQRLSIEDFPIPAYDQVDFMKYYVGSVQWSSGCPYRCEFCDIPALYGRVPRFKSPERLLRELDVIVERSPVGGIYFVDDNLIGNKKAAKELLRALVGWQKRNGYRARFAAECTINVAADPELLSLLREACFTDIFFGIESPNAEVLESIDKGQNLKLPLLEAVKIINSYGIELSAGIIFGFDHDSERSADEVIKFVEQSNIPFITANILTAMPKTPLWERLEKEGRIEGERLYGMNIRYKLGRDELMAQWRKLMAAIYSPDALYRRFRHQMQATLPNRVRQSPLRFRVTPELVQAAIRTFGAVFSHIGMKSSYRAEFWRMAAAMLRRNDPVQLLFWATMGRHFIGLAEDARTGALTHTWYDGPRWAAPPTATPSPRPPQAQARA